MDKWREAVGDRYRRYVAGLYFLLIAVGFGRQVALPVLITIGLSLNFFVLELASLIILGALFLRLQSYRLANLFLRAFNQVQGR